jgi:hypothetical protein
MSFFTVFLFITLFQELFFVVIIREQSPFTFDMNDCSVFFSFDKWRSFQSGWAREEKGVAILQF